MIKRQRPKQQILVDDAKDDTENEGACTLVNKASEPLGNDENVYKRTNPGNRSTVFIKRLYNRTCRDFANVRYTYAISDDSTVHSCC